MDDINEMWLCINIVWNMSSLVQGMFCNLVGTQPLLNYSMRQLEFSVQWNLNQDKKNFFQDDVLWECLLSNNNSDLIVNVAGNLGPYTQISMRCCNMATI